jgi:hypothetical protein
MEISTETTVTIGLLVIILGATFSFGVMWQKVENLRKQLDKFERKIEEIEKKIDKLITNIFQLDFEKKSSI